MKLLRRNAYAGITDREVKFTPRSPGYDPVGRQVTALRQGMRLHVHENFTFGRKLDRVAQKIDQDLPQPCPIPDDLRRRLIVEFVAEVELFLARPRGEEVERFLDTSPQVKRAMFQLQ